MTSTRLFKGHGTNDGRHLRSRTSSATLFFAWPSSDQVDGPADATDMIIAQGLLQGESPPIPRRRSSFSLIRSAWQPPVLEAVGDNTGGIEKSKDLRTRQDLSSNTWSSSGGDASEDDANDDRTPFVQEYNRLAMKYGVEAILPDEFVTINVDKVTIVAKQGSWIMRKLLRRTSSMQASIKTENHLRHRRSVSDLSIRLRTKRDSLKDKGLLELVRLCGASPLYLPAEYAPGTLAVPTCFRATAQYLVQYAASSRGIFRIPGSHSTINALYNHYASQDDSGEVINGTVRCPTLPEHIKCSVHDVASAFKKFLAGLPGGILGKAWIFQSFVSIYNHLDAIAERTRTKQSKVRARLIALTIASIVPRYQRELICAVFGLLSMIGRAAETAEREDEHGRPLPTSDLMGYGALGIIFGPLLVGDLLENYDLRPTSLHSSLTFNQHSPPKSLKGKHKKNKSADPALTLGQGADKIRIVNNITEMLITHWRDVVRHMKNLGALRPIKQNNSFIRAGGRALLRPSASESFTIRRPPDWDAEKTSIRHVGRNKSPTPSTRNNSRSASPNQHVSINVPQKDMLSRKKQRLGPRPRSLSSQMLSGGIPTNVLSPTAEEAPFDERYKHFTPAIDSTTNETKMLRNSQNTVKSSQNTQTFYTTQYESVSKSNRANISVPSMKPSPALTKNHPAHMALRVSSNAKDVKITAEVGGHQPSITTPIIQERSLGKESKGGDRKASEREVTETMECKAIPLENPEHFNDKFADYGSITALRESFEHLYGKAKAPSLVPRGTISNPLQGTASTDPGSDPPSSLREQLNGESAKISFYRRRTATRTVNSSLPRSAQKDPLSRVSKEEDIASLALLAKAIRSEDDDIAPKLSLASTPLTEPGASGKASIAPAKSTRSDFTSSELYGTDHSWNVNTRNAFGIQLTSKSRTTSPASMQRLPATPQRFATELKVPGRVAGSSVRALAARFNNADQNLSSSPRTTLGPRKLPRPQLESGVISAYTMNPSPVQRLCTLNKSDQSWYGVQNSLPVKTFTPDRPEDRTPPLLMKPLLIAERRQYYSGPPQWPKLRPIRRSPQLAQVASKITPFQGQSNLRRQGDGNTSFSMPRKLSGGTLLSNSKAPSIAEYVGRVRTWTPRPDLSPSPFDVSTLNTGLGSLDYDVVTSLHSAVSSPRDHNTSIMLTQLRHLQHQLRIRTEEMERLKLLLLNRNRLSNPVTLGEQLNEIKREAEHWRYRAKVAEKRLRKLRRLGEGQDATAVTECQMPGIKSLADNSSSLNEDLKRGMARVDGAKSEHQYSETEGTVRHESPMLFSPTACPIDLCEAQENLPFEVRFNMRRSTTCHGIKPATI